MVLIIAMVLALVPAAAGEIGATLEIGARPAAAPAPPVQSAPDARFVPVAGGTLRARLQEAMRQGRAARQERFWAAYAFDVRPGVAVDAQLRDKNGKVLQMQGFTVNIGDAAQETRNLAVFLLYAPGSDAPERVEIYNLDRPRDYEGHPVYWLGRAPSGESFELLQGLVAPGATERVVERAVAAVAIHDDPRAGDVLESIVRTSTDQRARASAVTWIGTTTERVDFLAGLVRDERETAEVREHAATAIGIGRSAEAIPTLRTLFREVTGRRIREHVLVAISIHDESRGGEAAVAFLVGVLDDERDADLRRQALFWLSQKAGKRSLDAITRRVDDPESGLQEHAVFAISQRPREEALPILMELAKTHRNPEVRKKAIFWLGQIDDERVVAFFKELLGT